MSILLAISSPATDSPDLGASVVASSGDLFADARDSDDWAELAAAPPSRSRSASPVRDTSSASSRHSSSRALQRPLVMQCFYCLRSVPRAARFVICDACDGFVACERCWDDARPDRGVEGRHVDWLEERKQLLLRRDRRLPRGLRQWRRLRDHEFDMAHADWTRDPTHFSLTTYREYDAAFATGRASGVGDAAAASDRGAAGAVHVHVHTRAAAHAAPSRALRAAYVSTHSTSSEDD